MTKLCDKTCVELALESPFIREQAQKLHLSAFFLFFYTPGRITVKLDPHHKKC